MSPNPAGPLLPSKRETTRRIFVFTATGGATVGEVCRGLAAINSVQATTRHVHIMEQGSQARAWLQVVRQLATNVFFSARGYPNHLILLLPEPWVEDL